MKYHARDYLAVLGSHAALLLAVYTWMLAGLPEPEAGALTVYVHIVLSGVFCLVCASRWGGFAATAAMTLLLWHFPLAQIVHACRLSVLITHWELTLLVLAFAAVYSFTRYDGLQKLFAALRVEVFFLLLFGLLVFPFFGMDALAVWESVREGISNGVHALLGILYA